MKTYSRLYYSLVCNYGIGAAYDGGVWKTDSRSGLSTKIKPTCYLDERSSMSVISDERALVSRKLCHTEDGHFLECYTGIFLLNLKTGEEEIVHLP